jgi:hypothetical protein
VRTTGRDLELRALLHGKHLVDDLLRGLARDALAADRAVRGAGPGVQQTQVVVHLGDGADGRAGLRLVDFWSIDTAGERPSMKSTSGLSI